MKIKFFGGVEEIGGNKFLLESSKSKLWLDFGISFRKWREFFSEFLAPRKCAGLTDFFELGLLPDLPGLYRSDFVKKTKAIIERPSYDGLLLSHCHLDHSGFIPLLHRDIPVYCGETTALILQSMQETGSGFEVEFCTHKEHFTGLSPVHVPKFARSIQPFRTGDELRIGDVVVQPIHVHHSVPGAYGFIISSGKAVLGYTGDLRKERLTEDFVEAARDARLDALLCEGTRLDGRPSLTEAEVEEQLYKLISEAKGLVCANWPQRDIDRLRSFWSACKRAGRKLVVSPRIAHLINQLESDDRLDCPRLSEFGIYFKRLESGLLTEPGAPKEKVEKEYPKWQRRWLWQRNALNWQDIAAEQGSYVLYLDNFSLQELCDIRPRPGSAYVYSLTEPFSEEMAIDIERIKNWAMHFGLAWHEVHASGHMSAQELFEMVEEIKPKLLIPIHTELPELFKRCSPRLKLPKPGGEIVIAS